MGISDPRYHSRRVLKNTHSGHLLTSGLHLVTWSSASMRSHARGVASVTAVTQLTGSTAYSSFSPNLEYDPLLGKW